jgi:hypothetical protein
LVPQAGAAGTGKVIVDIDGDARIGAKATSDRRIAVGESASWTVHYACYTTGYVDELVTGTVSGQPGGTTWVYNPKKVRTNPPTTTAYTFLTIKTFTHTRPGRYVIRIGGRGTACPDYSPAYVNLVVAPKIVYAENDENEKVKDVWWFNGERPRGYWTTVKVFANPVNVSRYDWRVSSGAGYAEFIDGSIPNSPATVTTIRSVDMAAKDPGPPRGKGAFSVIVSVNGVDSDPFPLKVRRPFKINPLPSTGTKPNPDDEGDFVFGYKTKIHYQIEDQLGDVLPSPLPAREVFTTREIDDIPSNWTIGSNAGYSGKPSNPEDFADVITGQNIINGPNPGTQAPCKPNLCDTRVFHFCGYISVGSGVAGKGVMVATLTWQRFRDHARHCDLATPKSTTPGDNMPACPGRGAAVCP